MVTYDQLRTTYDANPHIRTEKMKLQQDIALAKANATTTAKKTALDNFIQQTRKQGYKHIGTVGNIMTFVQEQRKYDTRKVQTKGGGNITLRSIKNTTNTIKLDSKNLNYKKYSQTSTVTKKPNKVIGIHDDISQTSRLITDKDIEYGQFSNTKGIPTLTGYSLPTKGQEYVAKSNLKTYQPTTLYVPPGIHDDVNKQSRLLNLKDVAQGIITKEKEQLKLNKYVDNKQQYLADLKNSSLSYSARKDFTNKSWQMRQQFEKVKDIENERKNIYKTFEKQYGRKPTKEEFKIKLASIDKQYRIEKNKLNELRRKGFKDYKNILKGDAYNLEKSKDAKTALGAFELYFRKQALEAVDNPLKFANKWALTYTIGKAFTWLMKPIKYVPKKVYTIGGKAINGLSPNQVHLINFAKGAGGSYLFGHAIGGSAKEVYLADNKAYATMNEAGNWIVFMAGARSGHRWVSSKAKETHKIIEANTHLDVIQTKKGTDGTMKTILPKADSRVVYETRGPKNQLKRLNTYLVTKQGKQKYLEQINYNEGTISKTWVTTNSKGKQTGVTKHYEITPEGKLILIAKENKAKIPEDVIANVNKNFIKQHSNIQAELGSKDISAVYDISGLQRTATQYLNKLPVKSAKAHMQKKEIGQKLLFQTITEGISAQEKNNFIILANTKAIQTKAVKTGKRKITFGKTKTAYLKGKVFERPEPKLLDNIGGIKVISKDPRIAFNKVLAIKTKQARISRSEPQLVKVGKPKTLPKITQRKTNKVTIKAKKIKNKKLLPEKNAHDTATIYYEKTKPGQVYQIQRTQVRTDYTIEPIHQTIIQKKINSLQTILKNTKSKLKNIRNIFYRTHKEGTAIKDTKIKNIQQKHVKEIKKINEQIHALSEMKRGINVAVNSKKVNMHYLFGKKGIPIKKINLQLKTKLKTPFRKKQINKLAKQIKKLEAKQKKFDKKYLTIKKTNKKGIQKTTYKKAPKVYTIPETIKLLKKSHAKGLQQRKIQQKIPKLPKVKSIKQIKTAKQIQKLKKVRAELQQLQLELRNTPNKNWHDTHIVLKRKKARELDIKLYALKQKIAKSMETPHESRIKRTLLLRGKKAQFKPQSTILKHKKLENKKIEEIVLDQILKDMIKEKSLTKTKTFATTKTKKGKIAKTKKGAITVDKPHLNINKLNEELHLTKEIFNKAKIKLKKANIKLTQQTIAQAMLNELKTNYAFKTKQTSYMNQLQKILQQIDTKTPLITTQKTKTTPPKKYNIPIGFINAKQPKGKTTLPAIVIPPLPKKKKKTNTKTTKNKKEEHLRIKDPWDWYDKKWSYGKQQNQQYMKKYGTFYF